jgi:DNA-binding response OmpR family regulator
MPCDARNLGKIMATILLVEDDRFLSDTIRSYLEFKHHVVDRAFEGPEALDKMQHGVYDLVILDWQLPGMDGIDVCRNYRSTISSGAQVLMLTGRTDPKEIEAATAAGATGFLPKPFKLDQLEKNVEKILSERVSS